MAASTITEPTGHAIGTTTIGATLGALTGYGIGTAVADILVNAFPGVGPVEDSVAKLIEFALLIVGTLLGGKVTPSNQVKTVTEVIPVAAPDPEAKAAAAVATEPETIPELVDAEPEVDYTRLGGSTAA